MILDPSLAEGFEVELDGATLGPIPTASAPGAVLTLTFTAP